MKKRGESWPKQGGSPARPNEPSEELGFSSVLELLERHIGVKECFELPLELNL